jgi:hypothetical protein
MARVGYYSRNAKSEPPLDGPIGRSNHAGRLTERRPPINAKGMKRREKRVVKM